MNTYTYIYILFFFKAVCLPDDPEGNAKLMLSILDCLPRANRVIIFHFILNLKEY